MAEIEHIETAHRDFHMVAKRNKALDEVRAGEARRMEAPMQRPARASYLLGDDAGVLDQLGVTQGFRTQQCIELLRRASHDFRAQLGQAFANVG
jgi:hypothetical protein